MLLNISIAIDREFYHCDDNEHISMNVLFRFSRYICCCGSYSIFSDRFDMWCRLQVEGERELLWWQLQVRIYSIQPVVEFIFI